MRMGAPEPKPLRSSQFPLGLPSLSNDDANRVNKANQIYRNIARLVRECVRRDVVVSVENPTRSYLWETPLFRELIAEGLLHEVAFQQCMWGSSRDKWSSWYVSTPLLDGLARVCDGSHQHAGWGVRRIDNKWHFATADEAAYPQKLCDEVAHKIVALANEAAVVWVQPQVQNKRRKTASVTMAAAGRQPRGNRYPPVIPEFAFIKTITTTLKLQLPSHAHLSQAQCLQLHVPYPSKLLALKERKDQTSTLEAEIGVWRSPEQFLERAKDIKHPFDDSSSVDDATKNNIFKLLTEGQKARSDRVEEMFGYYEWRARVVQHEEDCLHQTLEPGRQRIIKGKRFLLFEEMCRDAGLPEEHLTFLQLNGVPLVGQDAATSLFRQEEIKPAMSEEQLMKSSRWSRRKILGSRKGELQSDEVRAAVWDITMEEVAKGWLQGPYSESELVELLGPLFVASKRFGLQQPDKVRQIDNLSESLVNSAYGSSYKLDLAGVDGISVLARTFMEAVQGEKVCVTKSGGGFLVGSLHPSWSSQEAREIGGRTLDLAAAYKQVLVAKRSLWCSVLVVEDPAGEKRLFVSQVLPFGAASSVYSFNKIARAIQLVGTRLFELIWTSYYDDFPQIDVLSAGDWAQTTAERFLNLIGWTFSAKESKRMKLASTFAALGVTFDFCETKLGVVKVKNKLSRVQQICETIRSILQKGCVTEAEAATLMGRLQFAVQMKDMRGRACGKKAGKHLTSDMANELAWAEDFVTISAPRILLADSSKSRVLVFTDAALEKDDTAGTVGMVALRMVGDQVAEKFYFADVVPESLMSQLQNVSKKVIAGLELMAGIVAVVLLSRLKCSGRMFLFVDNEAARACLISMNSSVGTHNARLRFLNEITAKQSLHVGIKSAIGFQPCRQAITSSFQAP